MSQNLKAILTFIAVFIFLVIAGFNSVKYWDKSDKELELTKAEQENNRVIDSLESKIFRDSVVIAELLTAKETEKTNRTNYNANYQKRKEDTKKTSYNDDKSFNDNFILNFRPKY